MKDYYEIFNVPAAINAAGTSTLYGGCRTWPDAADAMARAAQNFIDLEMLNKKAGEYIANLLNVEAALVTAGASPALVQAAAACMAGMDPYLRHQLPGNPPIKNEIIIHRIHRNPYDNAIPTAGARFVEIGDAIKTYAWELDNAITERTAAVFYALQAEMMDASLSLDETLAVAHAHNLPVIVDAAAEIPPKRNLWELSQRGADLVVFSGGKDIRGPQSSGLMVGKKDLINAAEFNGAPHYGVGRPMKAGKEIIVGLTAAIECYLAEDEDSRFAHWNKIQSMLLEKLNTLPNVSAQEHIQTQMGVHPIHIPKIRLELSPDAKMATNQLADRLQTGSPPIFTQRWRGSIILHMQVLTSEEANIIFTKIKEILSNN